MLVPPLPLSISGLEYFQSDLDFRQFAEEHWASLYPLCAHPVRVEKNNVRLRVVLFDIWFIDRGINHEFIRDGVLTENPEQIDENDQFKKFDVDNLIPQVGWVLGRIQSFDKRFEFALCYEPGDEALPFMAEPMERRREVSDRHAVPPQSHD